MGKTKETSFVDDALRLMLITVVTGLLLSIIYTVTYGPTQTAQNVATIAAYEKIFPDIADFKGNLDSDRLIAANAASLAEQGFGSAIISKVVDVVDTSGNVIGHIISTGSKGGYGGLVSISVGIQSDDKTVNGIVFLTIAESVGLGMNARDIDWYEQFNGREGERFTVTKTGDDEPDDDEINAVSSVTTTSRAVTNSVNTAFYFVNDGLNQ